MVAEHPDFDLSEDLSEERLRSRFEMMQPQIRERVERSCSAQGVVPDASVESAVEQAYNLFVLLAQQGFVDLAYPTPLALAALRLHQQKRRSGE